MLLISSLAFSSTLFIGNGGEVFKVNNAYYVRDLVEADVHKQPYFHCDRGDIRKVDLKKLAALGLDIDLLGRKLCDIDKVVPGMADILAATINFHSWTLVSEKLNLLPDDAPLLKLPAAERIQAANRTLFNIRLQANVWKSLTAQHRIALLFHEVTFSLLKFSCINDPCTQYKQSSRLAREITGLLFRQDTYDSESEIKKLNSLIRLSFYTSHPAPETAAPHVRVKITISNNTTINVRLEKKETQDVPSFVEQTCREYYSVAEPNNPWTLFLLISSKSWKLDRVSYPSEYGVEYGLSIREISANNGVLVSGFNTQQSCVAKLAQRINELSL